MKRAGLFRLYLLVQMAKTAKLSDGHQRNVRLSGSGGQVHDRIFGDANILHLVLIEPGDKIFFRRFLRIKKN